jgi:hypothetical protein
MHRLTVPFAAVSKASVLLITFMSAAATPAMASQTSDVLKACKNTPGCSYQKNGNHYDGWDKKSTLYSLAGPAMGA